MVASRLPDSMGRFPSQRGNAPDSSAVLSRLMPGLMLILLGVPPVHGMTWEDIVAATKAHHELIQSGTGEYTYTYETTDEAEGYLPRHVTYTGQWTLKGNQLRLSYAGERKGAEYYRGREGKVRSEYQFLESSELFYDKDRKTALAMVFDSRSNTRNHFCIPGLLSASFFHEPITQSQKLVAEGKLQAAIEENLDTGVISIRQWRDAPDHAKGVIRIDPSKQYSIVEDVFESMGDNPVVNRGHVEMEWIEDAGIWFPARAEFTYHGGSPLVLKHRETFEFRNTRLNVPISEEQITVTMPAGVSVTDGFSGTGYTTRESLTLKQIITGEAWKSHVEGGNKASPSVPPPATRATQVPAALRRSRIPAWITGFGIVVLVVAIAGILITRRRA